MEKLDSRNVLPCLDLSLCKDFFSPIGVLSPFLFAVGVRGVVGVFISLDVSSLNLSSGITVKFVTFFFVFKLLKFFVCV